MANEEKVIDVRIEERLLNLEYVDTEIAVFKDRKGFALQMPRSTWNAKGRPGIAVVGGEVQL